MISLLLAAAVAAATPADYKVVYQLPLPNGALVIQAGRFHCPEGQKRAILVAGDELFIGCAGVSGTAVEITFEDGDTGRIESPPPAGQRQL